MAEPHVAQLEQTLSRLDTVAKRGPGARVQPVLMSQLADEAVLAHLIAGFQASRRALALPPRPDARAQAVSAIRELRAAIAVYEEWQVPE